MWYSTGTVSVTNGSSTVTGSGTAFLANARIGDGIVIQGSTAMHEIIGIASDTSLTIRPAYAGTTGAGRQFAVAPMLGYDKDLSDAFNEIRLQFGDTLSALKPWAYAATANAALDALEFSASGKSVATGTPAQGRSALGLGSAATRGVTGGSGDLMAVGSFGVGVTTPPIIADLNAIPDGQLFGRLNNDTLNQPISTTSLATVQVIYWSESFVTQIVTYRHVTNRMFFRTLGGGGTWSAWVEFITSNNSTVDTNGFLKAASPVIKLFSDHVEPPDSAPSFTRIGEGHYQVANCNGLRLTDGWYIETPQDRNGNKYFNVEWEQDSEPDADNGVIDEPADVTLTVRCYERVWNPETGRHENGDPVDIHEGRWIDLRMNEVRQPDPDPITD